MREVIAMFKKKKKKERKKEKSSVDLKMHNHNLDFVCSCNYLVVSVVAPFSLIWAIAAPMWDYLKISWVIP